MLSLNAVVSIYKQLISAEICLDNTLFVTFLSSIRAASVALHFPTNFGSLCPYYTRQNVVSQGFCIKKINWQTQTVLITDYKYMANSRVNTNSRFFGDLKEIENRHPHGVEFCPFLSTTSLQMCVLNCNQLRQVQNFKVWVKSILIIKRKSRCCQCTCMPS